MELFTAMVILALIAFVWAIVETVKEFFEGE